MEHISIKIHGIVQGVGFRPFIHKLVRDFALTGFIANTSSGVELELEGEHDRLESFLEEIPLQAPKLAVIEKTEAVFSDKLYGYCDFEIRTSKTEALRNTLISPDICICDDCLRELNTPADRRYRYPFINCTNCGPRFTIIKDVPYDRIKTSMGAFPMCPDCDSEYHNIENRRYHAQPDCCPDCGPHVFFILPNGEEVPEDAIETARSFLKEGKIIAVKGLGGMHLACRADLPETARLLRRRKQRDEKPFAVMCRDVAAARKICFVSDEEEKILTGFRRPIVLLKKRTPGLKHLSENGFVGVMLPYTPLHYLLFGDDLDMLIMTSANLSDTPIMYRNEDALENLQVIADGFLLHNRDIQTRCDDSLCWVLDGREYFARRSRGYVPYPVTAPFPALPENKYGLACGAEQKASFCLSREDYIFPSQHIGDLKNYETLEHYERQITHFEHLFDIRPQFVACDLHPDYMSTETAEKTAAELGIPLFRIQHHHAHMAACMADNGLRGPVIGLVWDGTGLGTDGTVWGGECLVGDYLDFARFSHIRPIPLPGGDLCTKEISRTAFSLLKSAGCPLPDTPEAKLISSQLEKNLNCPLSSGMGRLFDGVAAILGICSRSSYEGQGAVLLEASAALDVKEKYEVSLIKSGNSLVFDWQNMIKSIVEEKQNGISAPILSARFFNTLSAMAEEVCLRAREQFDINRVCLSGGTFQNMVLMQHLPEALRNQGFSVYHHGRVSPNDEGISLGQLMIAREKLAAGKLE